VSLVAASEADLLTVARALVAEVPVEVAEPLLRTRHQLQPKISPDAMVLLKHTLAAGVTLQLSQRGGWISRRHLQAGKVVGGRLWERHADLPLRFSSATMQLCRWLVATPLGMPDISALHVKDELTMADEVVLYLACDLLVRSGLGLVVNPAVIFGRSALCWLGFPVELRGIAAASEPPTADRFLALVTGACAPVLEALQQDLQRRWIQLERGKSRIRDCRAMVDLCDLEKKVLESFLDALDRAGRQDLAGFLGRAAADLLPDGVAARHFCEGLDHRSALSDRAQARFAAGAFLRTLSRPQAWVDTWRATAFFEDGYAAAQMLLSEWEVLGEPELTRARAVLHELENLDAGLPAALTGGNP
jgi:hypothetical protein